MENQQRMKQHTGNSNDVEYSQLHERFILLEALKIFSTCVTEYWRT